MMRMLLMHEDMYDCVESEDQCKDAKKKQKALAKICLSVSTSALTHVRNAKSPYQAWTNLESAYEDKGLSRRLGLLRSLFSIKLENAAGMEAYLSRIAELSQQLKDIGSSLDDDFIAIIMLSGLPHDYDPLIMALEHSGTKLSSDVVKTKLLQENIRRDEKMERPDFQALTVKKTARCFKCKKPGHLRKDCPSRSPSTKMPNVLNKNYVLLTALAVNVHTHLWYIDSGATNHMCNNRQIMSDFVMDTSLEVKVANGEKLRIGGRGVVTLRLKDCEVTITNVFYVPNLSANLLSVSELVRKGRKVTFDSKGCTICNGKEVIATATYLRGVYQLDTLDRLEENVSLEIAMCSGADAGGDAAVVTQEVWHKRLAHLSLRSMNQMKRMVTGMAYSDTDIKNCVACLEGKQVKNPFPKKSVTRSKELLGLIHTDVCGPIEVLSLGGARYFVTFIDDCSRKTYIYFLRTKDEVFEKFKCFKALAENETGKKIKVLRSDNGGEYVNFAFQKYLESSGIAHQTTVPYCSQQNGVAERANRTIMDKARCLLQEAGLSKAYWAEAVNTAVYLKNRSPTIAVAGVVPEERWSNKKVDIKHLRVFGSVAYALQPNLRKLDARSKKYIFVGYCDNTKGYKLVDPSCPKRVITARHVTFLENVFVKNAMSHDDKKGYKITIPCESLINNSDSTAQESLDMNDSRISDCEQQPAVSNPRRETIFGLDETSIIMDSPADETYVPDYSGVSEDSEMSFQDLDSSDLAQLAGMIRNDSDVPETVEEALKSIERNQWKAAMQEEYNSFLSNNCWSLVDLPEGKRSVKCKWVFSKKRGLNGELLKYKARLVAKGCTQKYGVDYTETFSPVVRYSTIRILLAMAAQQDMEVEHMDVKTAFLNGNLQETVFMEQPECFQEKGKESQVCLLKKAVYGLKQAAKSWYEKINHVLTGKLKFRKLLSEPCVFVYNAGEELIIIALYVDDIVLFSSRNSHIKKEDLKKQLMNEFEMTDLGQASHVLGMRITRSGGKISLDQTNYITKILERFNMADCKPAQTPMESGLKLQREENSDCNLEYRNLVGSLMYLAVCTRPDIAYVISYLSQFNNCFSELHWKAAKRVLRYLRGTINYCLVFEKGDTKIIGYTDADWAANEVDRRSYTGYVFSLGTSVVSWESRKQRTVALSSAEAEYMAISDACKEGLFLRAFINECFGFLCTINLSTDSQSAQKICNSISFHARTKHIDIRHHFVKQMVNEKVVVINYTCGNDMLADILTKSLPKEKHEKFSSLLLCCRYV